MRIPSRLRRAHRAAGSGVGLLMLAVARPAIASSREQVLDTVGAALGFMASAWQYEVVIVDGQSVTVRNIVLAGVLLWLGYVVSQRLSTTLGRTLRARFTVEEGAATAIESISFYALLVVFGLLALRSVSFPIAIFTVIGGALAIGIGFGSQNVMNNFISGLLLLLERPVKAGDLIEVGGTFGHVERIGARSTWVKTSGNTHIIVPNSTFLQENVLNWTLSDDLIRTQVNVGVVYGAPTREVERIVLQVLADHSGVLATPPPVILFADFGDNSLNFEAIFWVRTRQILQKRRIESDIRFAIDDRFREAGIVIAFPQRDVHLDAARPLPVELIERRPEDVPR